MNPYFSVKEEYPSSSYSQPEDDPPMMLPPQPMEGLNDPGPPPFLTKTFDMVDDPDTNYIVCWSRGGSSFVVWDPHSFSTNLLPRYFKQVLVMELVKLRQQQQNTRAYLQAVEERLQGTEKKQKQMMSFLARAMQNPAFLQQLMQQKEKRKELEEAMSKKRRRPIDQGPSGVAVGESIRGSEGTNHVKTEPLEFGDYGFQVTELEALALEMQGYGRARTEQEEAQDELEHRQCHDKELDEGFWEELLNERFEGELDIPGTEGGEDEDVNVLADRLGYLGSCPK
ncbi:Heat stress transcription factor A-6b isoform 8 [Theobroma cacao]|uniref:Heat stress transcription factor A-6b isoform 8 n=1 Tax=Theobroma cacao TaxID=3641 RepID=A0A061DQI5_THECC|nr:Heat stress transcription factor A-6b isoform 8 [Theobroma cacao]